MSDEIVFYSNPRSRSAIARWMLEEVGHPYRMVNVEFGPEMKTPEYLALNPMGKVPTIVHGDTVVTECAAICAYLADAFPDAGLAPDPAARGAYYRWLFTAAGPLEQAVVAKALGVEVPPERRGMVGFAPLPVILAAVESAVEGGYVCGDRFTAADVYLGSQIGWGLRFGTIDASPGLTAYWDRLSGRPAARRVLGEEPEG